MAFIKETERKSLIKKINESYALKKIIVLLEIILLAGFIVLTFYSLWKTSGDNPDEKWRWFDGEKLTGLGIGMLVYAIVNAVLGIIAVILVFTIKSPKKIMQANRKLESSAISGKKITKNQTAGEIMKSRTTLKPSSKKKSKR